MEETPRAPPAASLLNSFFWKLFFPKGFPERTAAVQKLLNTTRTTSGPPRAKHGSRYESLWTEAWLTQPAITTYQAVSVGGGSRGEGASLPL